MNSFTRVPVTAAVFAGLAILLSGCIAYDAASTVVSAGSSVVGAGVSVVGAAGDVVTSPFDSDDSKKK
jgi:archaellin